MFDKLEAIEARYNELQELMASAAPDELAAYGRELASLERVAVEHLDRAFAVLVGRHLDESEPTRTPGLTIKRQGYRLNRSGLTEQASEFVLAGAVGKNSYV